MNKGKKNPLRLPSTFFTMLVLIQKQPHRNQISAPPQFLLLPMQSCNHQKRFSPPLCASKLLTTYISRSGSSCKPKTTLTALCKQPYTYVTNFRMDKENKHNKTKLIQTDRISVTMNQMEGRRRKIAFLNL